MSLFQARLKELKECSGKTQARIAEDLGVTPQAFSYYVNGREPDYDVLIKIAEYFNVSIDYLLGISQTKHLENIPLNLNFGLNDEAIQNLYKCNEDRDDVDALSFFIGHPLFPTFIKNLYLYGVFDSNEVANILEEAVKKVNDISKLDDFSVTLSHLRGVDMTDTLMSSAIACLRTIMFDYRNKFYDIKTGHKKGPAEAGSSRP